MPILIPDAAVQLFVAVGAPVPVKIGGCTLAARVQGVRENLRGFALRVDVRASANKLVVCQIPASRGDSCDAVRVAPETHRLPEREQRNRLTPRVINNVVIRIGGNARLVAIAPAATVAVADRTPVPSAPAFATEFRYCCNDRSVERKGHGVVGVNPLTAPVTLAKSWITDPAGTRRICDVVVGRVVDVCVVMRSVPLSTVTGSQRCHPNVIVGIRCQGREVAIGARAERGAWL